MCSVEKGTYLASWSGAWGQSMWLYASSQPPWSWWLSLGVGGVVANALASGLWAGFLYVGAGVLGVLASTLGQSI